MTRRNLRSCSQDIKQKAYKSLVRPILENSHTVWDPYQQNHIDQLEKIQRKAVRFVTSNYSRLASVTALRESLKWTTLQQRRCVARLTMFHKTINNMSAVNIPDHFQRPTRLLRNQHDQSFINTQTSTNFYRFSFFPRTIRCWNLLPSSLIHMPDHTAFQSNLRTLIDNGKITICRPIDEDAFRSRIGSFSQQQPIVIH